MEEYKEMITNHLPSIVGGLTTIIVFWILAYIFKKMIGKLLSSVDGAYHIKQLISSTLFYTVIIVGLLTGLNTMGIKVAPIVATLGLGGFALGFALKDVLSNFLAGALILIYQPFHVGDYLLVVGCEGLVSEINMRYTVLASNEKTYMIPNSVIFSNPLQLKAAKE